MNFDKLNPIELIDSNVVLTSYGDVSVCFKIILPEANTISLKGFNDVHDVLVQSLSILPENVAIHRKDVFLNSEMNVETIFDKSDTYNTFLYEHFKGRNYLKQESYLYITLLDGFGFKRNIGNITLFKNLTNTSEFNAKIDDFKNTALKFERFVSDSIKIRPLTQDELIDSVDQHFNGYALNKVVSPEFKPKFKIGKLYFTMYGLDEDINQKDGHIDICAVNSTMSSELSKMYKSYMAPLSSELNFEHTVDTFIYYDNQSAIKGKLEKKQKNLNSVKMMGKINERNSERIDNFMNGVEQENVKIVRAHVNVTAFDVDENVLLAKERDIQTAFLKMGIVPREFDYLDYPYLFLSNTPGCCGHLPSDYTFISYDALAFAYTVKEGNEVLSDLKGLYYCNRNTNVPFILDSFYSPYESKLIDNRNYFVIAPSGGGKSFSSRSRTFQQYQQGFDQVVINLGGDDKMVRLINSYGKDEASYVTYKEGEPLPVNPFYISEYVTNGKLEFLIDFIWLLWGGEDEISNDKRSILNKILVDFYSVDLSSETKEGFEFSISENDMNILSFYNYIQKNTSEITKYFGSDSSMFNINSLTINLEKFAIGTYKNLFLSGVPEIHDKKKYVEFELDNIKDHPFLFPLFSMLISDITFNTMWDDKGYKDFFIDEAWKILEKSGMALLLKYLYKTIRKFDGAVGIAVQQITDVAINDIIENAILGNCAIKYILNHKSVLDQVPLLKRKLSLTEQDVAMLLSIKNKLKPSYPGDIYMYSELLLLMGSEYSKILRVETCKELACIYDSDKKRLKRFNEIYAVQNKDMINTIKTYLN